MDTPSQHPLVASVVKQSSVNPQLYENNPVSTDPITQEYLNSDIKFAGDRPPNLAIQSENIQHRIIMYLRAQGQNSTEIAKATGYSYHWVCQVCRQPWFKKRLLETLAENGGDAVAKFVQGEVLPSLVALTEIRDDPESKDATRVAACNAILDRALGKPTQHVKTERVPTADDLTTEMSQIERELAEIQRQQRGVLPGSVAIHRTQSPN